MEEYLHTPLPMVNEINMKSFTGKYAIIHGKVGSIKNNTLFLKVNVDNNTDVIIKNVNKNIRPDSQVKVIGKILPDQLIEFLDYIQLPDEFDLKLLNEAIPIFQNKEVSNMFY
jgi:hypothetical protein